MSAAPLIVIPPIATDPGMLAPVEFERIVRTPSELVLVEYPGHGARPHEAGVTIAALAEEVASSIDDDAPADVVGIGMGAYVLAELLLNHASAVRSAMIVSSPITAIDDAARDRDRTTGAASASGMEAIVDATLERWFTAAAILTENPGVVAARRSLAGMAPEVWNDYWLAIADRATLDSWQLHDVTVPVTVVAPLHDCSDNPARLRALDRALPLSRLVYVNGSHMVQLEQPASILAALDSHLAWAALGEQATQPPALVWIGE